MESEQASGEGGAQRKGGDEGHGECEGLAKGGDEELSKGSAGTAELGGGVMKERA